MKMGEDQGLSSQKGFETSMRMVSRGKVWLWLWESFYVRLSRHHGHLHPHLFPKFSCDLSTLLTSVWIQ